jgi:hypothetical protein
MTTTDTAPQTHHDDAGAVVLEAAGLTKSFGEAGGGVADRSRCCGASTSPWRRGRSSDWWARTGRASLVHRRRRCHRHRVGVIASIFAGPRMLAMLTRMHEVPHRHFGLPGTPPGAEGLGFTPT